MKNLMQWKTILLYKQYDVDYMHVGISYANVFTELETSAYRKCTSFQQMLNMT